MAAVRLIKRVTRVMMAAGLAIWFAMALSVIVSALAGAFESTEAVFQLQAGPDVNRLSRGAALGSPRNAGSPSAVHKLPEPLRDEVVSRSVQPAPADIQSSTVKMRLLARMEPSLRLLCSDAQIHKRLPVGS
ncbi:MAG: hypothetical protein WBV94_07525 [Blastocatellia bacterium]